MTLPSPSTIDRLSPEIKAQLREWLQDPRVTQEQATDRTNELLEELGLPERVTKSSVGRAALRWKKVGDRVRQSREMGEMFVAKVGAAPQGQTGLMINEILRTIAYELSEKLLDVDTNDLETLPGLIDQVKALALAMQRLEQSATINVKRDDVIRAQEREKALRDAAEVMEKAGKKRGLSKDTVQQIRSEILGIAQ